MLTQHNQENAYYSPAPTYPRSGPASPAPQFLTYLPEIGTLDRRQVGSLAGVVPYNRDSGQWKGKSFISGGRKPLRDALYMPALVAMRYNPDMKQNTRPCEPQENPQRC